MSDIDTVTLIGPQPEDEQAHDDADTILNDILGVLTRLPTARLEAVAEYRERINPGCWSAAMVRSFFGGVAVMKRPIWMREPRLLFDKRVSPTLSGRIWVLTGRRVSLRDPYDYFRACRVTLTRWQSFRSTFYVTTGVWKSKWD